MAKKKLTEKQTWELCLQMWKWVAEQITKKVKDEDGYPKGSVELKIEWLEEHGYRRHQLEHNCFFCEYAKDKGEILIEKRRDDFFVCPTCPARKIQRNFSCENFSSYHWMDEPVKFYERLVELHKKFLKEKCREKMEAQHAN